MVEHKTPKEKKSGRKINLGQHKKAIISGGLIAVIAIAGLFTGLIIWEQQQKEDIEVVFSMPVFTGLEFIDTLEYFFPFSESAAIIILKLLMKVLNLLGIWLKIGHGVPVVLS